MPNRPGGYLEISIPARGFWKQGIIAMTKGNFDASADAEVIWPSAYSYGGFVQMRVAKPMERDAPLAVSGDIEIPKIDDEEAARGVARCLPASLRERE